jgi:DNA-binding NarL/FixJ family response regulator
MKTTKILLVEDDPRIAGLIVELVERSGPYAITTAATIAAAASALSAQSDRPDIVIVDLGLPDGDGVDLIAKVRAADGELPILVVTSATKPERIDAALAAGADGYLFKEDVSTRLVAALAELRANGTPMSAGAVRVMLRQLYPRPNHKPRLSPQELVVLELLSYGLGYQEIAEKSGKSIHTVRSQLQSVYAKLGVENRAEAVSLAWAHGLIRRSNDPSGSRG